MPVGLSEPDEITPVAGIKLASHAAGIKKNNSEDLVIFILDENTNCAATFTQNAFCAAPVTIAKKHSFEHQPRALLINSGNANAGTGDIGLQNTIQTCQWLAEKIVCLPEQILPFSTGVIGEQLPMEKVKKGIEKITLNSLSSFSEDNWLNAATGIMTTDTVAKGISTEIIIDGKVVTISGIAKGSGMICPNMATMLAFVATDADVDKTFLQQCLVSVVDDSFNSITVDGDTSTNDACVLLATGKAKNVQLNKKSEYTSVFIEGLKEVAQTLAESIVRDAEGATKFITVIVEQAKSKVEARNVAYTIAHSPLVKTAMFASDPNWGRILAAVGRADVDQLNISAVNIFLDEVCIVRNGGVDPDYTEEKGQTIMNQEEIAIRVELGSGEHSSTIWTSDLSNEYVRINSEYRS